MIRVNKLIERLNSCELSTVTLQGDVYSLVQGIKGIGFANCAIEISFRTSQPVVQINVNDCFGQLDINLQTPAVKQALMLVSDKHQNKTGFRKMPHISKPKDTFVSDSVNELIRDWHKLGRNEINERINCLTWPVVYVW